MPYASRLLAAVLTMIAVIGYQAVLARAASAETEGEAIVAAAQGIQSQAYPAQSFSTAKYLYCFAGGTTTGASPGTADPDPEGSYSNCNSIGRTGFDCRGLTLYSVYQGTGGAVTLPTATAGAQYAGASSYGGSYISLAAVQPGDLVFFGSSASSIDHVGIVVSGTGSSALIISAINEEDGISSSVRGERTTVHWFEHGSKWVGAVAIPGVGNTVGGHEPPPPPNSTRGVVLDQASEQMFFFTEGAANSLEVRWNVAGQPWNGPQTVAESGTTYSDPAVVLDPASGQMFVYTEGPEHSLQVRWDEVGQPWVGTETIGEPGSTYSAPDVVFNESSGQMFVYTEGPEHSLQVRWDEVGQPWAGPETIGGAGTTYSAPAAVIDQHSRQMFVYAEGPDHSLETRWDEVGQPWTGPETIGDPGTTYSAPDAVFDEASSQVFVYAEGADHSLETRWVALGDPWTGETIGEGTTYSVPNAVIDQSSSQIFVFSEGPSHSEQVQWVTLGQEWNGPEPIGADEGTYSAAEVVLNTKTSFMVMLTQGAANTLDAYWDGLGGAWAGPEEIGGAGSTSMQEPLPVPVASSGSPVSISPVSEQLAGAVNPEGEPISECRFEYGTTTAYGSSAPCTGSIGEDDTAVPVSATVAGLKPGTEYQYRVVAIGPGGRSESVDATFTTAAFGVATASLPEGVVYTKTNKTGYAATLAASGGKPPYKWSLTTGSKLPPGLKLASSGKISGKASAAGTYTFTVEVVDAKTKTKPPTQNKATATLSITIAPA
jgi:hypothetical protein